ncbi:ANTAR domain-containing response regulator [Inhella crocodyli]|uniref:ANTAR domain-containing protein n=1 Tax=Inhella crocodyli TaxID=2499851 RepID=A0A3S2UW91_9BURK|nr:ANTAR domain-containing protein [Inhella crocodyli]RVT86400.1 ANTAR domain-containing protein [Inhella crocodyli]
MPNAALPSTPSLRVLLVDDGAHRVRHIAEALIQQGHVVVGVLAEATRIHDAVQSMRPDVVIVDAESPTRDTLENLALLNERAPRPVVMFAEDEAGEAMRAALKAGVSAYVVAGLSPQRLLPVMQVAQARFEQEQALRTELAEARSGAGQRKKVDEAKRILMAQLRLSEPEAHKRLQKLAMDRGVTAAVVAQQVIDAHQLLQG